MTAVLTLLGHLSFALQAASYLMQRLLWLRLLAIASLIIGIGYNSWLAISTPELWTVVGWLAVFLLINVVTSIRMVWENSEVQLTEPERDLASRAFPLMRSRDYRSLMEAATIVAPNPGSLLVREGDSMSAVYLVVKGRLIEKSADGAVSFTGRGQMIGEASFVTHEQYGGSPTNISVDSGTELASWSYEEINCLTEKRKDLARALLDGFVRGLVKKRNVLRTDVVDPGTRESFLTDRERLLHATCCPTMLTGQFKALLALSQLEQHHKGSELDNVGRIGIIADGELRIVREDGQHIVLGRGNFIGEVAFMAVREDKIRTHVHVLSDAAIYWLSEPALRSLREGNPPLYAAFVESIGRDMAIKLTKPLEGGEYRFLHAVP